MPGLWMWRRKERFGGAGGFRGVMDEHIAALPAAVNDPGVATDANHLPQNVYPGHHSPWGRAGRNMVHRTGGQAASGTRWCCQCHPPRSQFA